MTRPYSRRSSDEWFTLVEQQQTSGLSAPKFCEQQNVSYASFSKWRLQFNREHNAQQSLKANAGNDFVDLSTLSSSGKWHITLALGNGVELRLSQQ
jgi:putative transposase